MHRFPWQRILSGESECLQAVHSHRVEPPRRHDRNPLPSGPSARTIRALTHGALLPGADNAISAKKVFHLVFCRLFEVSISSAGIAGLHKHSGMRLIVDLKRIRRHVQAYRDQIRTDCCELQRLTKRHLTSAGTVTVESSSAIRWPLTEMRTGTLSSFDPVLRTGA